MSIEEDYTPAQVDAIRKAYTLLGEHFDQALICVDSESEKATDEGERQHCFYYCSHGSNTGAVGLAYRALKHLTRETKIE
jgi:hypothetical protein